MLSSHQVTSTRKVYAPKRPALRRRICVQHACNISRNKLNRIKIMHFQICTQNIFRKYNKTHQSINPDNTAPTYLSTTLAKPNVHIYTSFPYYRHFWYNFSIYKSKLRPGITTFFIVPRLIQLLIKRNVAYPNLPWEEKSWNKICSKQN